MDPENLMSKDAVLQQMTKENFERYSKSRANRP